jgi:hypothetical protein
VGLAKAKPEAAVFPLEVLVGALPDAGELFLAGCFLAGVLEAGGFFAGVFLGGMVFLAFLLESESHHSPVSLKSGKLIRKFNREALIK